jgi:hypothetical protein
MESPTPQELKRVFDDARRRFYFYINFLQKNNLVVRKLIDNESDIDENFCYKVSDLTDEGLEFTKIALAKYVNGIDRGKDPSNVKVLERELKKMRLRK